MVEVNMRMSCSNRVCERHRSAQYTQRFDVISIQAPDQRDIILCAEDRTVVRVPDAADEPERLTVEREGGSIVSSSELVRPEGYQSPDPIVYWGVLSHVFEHASRLLHIALSHSLDREPMVVLPDRFEVPGTGHTQKCLACCL